MTHWLAKIAGWTQFILTAGNQILGQPGATHGWQSWLVSIASLGVAIGVHAASSTDGSK